MKFSLTLVAILFSSAAFATESPASIRFDGFGLVRIGMTKTQVSQALGAKLKRTPVAGDNECEYLSAPSKWKGVEFLFSRGRVARIDVIEGTTSTETGIKIGDSIATIKKSYVNVTESDHQYIPAPQGKYLTAKSPDGKYAIRFEANDGKVITYYSGKFPEVTFGEHCL